MVFLSVFVLIFTNPNLILSEMLGASKGAVELCINLWGIYSVWLGLINILDKSGLSDKLAKLLSPLINFYLKLKTNRQKNILL